ncbi:hypothetical protein AM500_21395 [Bacillus sp. FJAT-18017]|uniref:phage head closure protein n=1 Tax=Bacillus sp. FJAT-18017 TaxID=1705566 RepID=UPI0006ADFC7C|nr:phage head closure protein [Bacillus sp. FJAT-18017]ALC92064.1 hypothetical protein AM500_21395 [Bacillus sp. FJAT-18017]
MNPGQLNKRVTFLKLSDKRNGYGEVVKGADNWKKVATVWANVKPLRGRELYSALQTHSEATTKVTIRYRKDIDATMKIQYGTKELQLVTPPINIDEKNRFLELVCKEVM